MMAEKLDTKGLRFIADAVRSGSMPPGVASLLETSADELDELRVALDNLLALVSTFDPGWNSMTTPEAVVVAMKLASAKADTSDDTAERDRLKEVNADLLAALKRMLSDCPPSTATKLWNNLGAREQATAAIKQAEAKAEGTS